MYVTFVVFSYVYIHMYLLQDIASLFSGLDIMFRVLLVCSSSWIISRWRGANHSSFLWIIVSCSSIHFLLYIYHFNDTGCSLNIDLFSKNSRKFPTSPSPALGFGWLYSDVGEGGVAVYCKKKHFSWTPCSWKAR